MTTVTAPPAALCGYRWPPAPLFDVQHEHRCQLDADHTDRCRCRCRCGAHTPEGTSDG